METHENIFDFDELMALMDEAEREGARQMKAQHTPGPWCLQSQGTGEPLSIMGQDNRFICRMDEGSFKDAELLAASWELLEALWGMVNSFAPHDGISDEEKEAAVTYATQILAKAEGKEG